VLILRRILAVVLLMAASLTLGVPATASIAHEADHVASPVSAGEYHHHDSDGTVDLQQDSAADEDGDASGNPVRGHSHPPASAADPAMLASIALALPSIRTRVPQDQTVRQLHTLSWSPHRRPPRAA
jgi:hypothetical protein